MRGLNAPIFVSLGIYDTNDAELNFGRLNALLIEKLQDGFLVGLGLEYTKDKSSPASLELRAQMARSDFTLRSTKPLTVT